MLQPSTVKNAKPAGKRYKLHDEYGLYLVVMPSGGKYWRLDYRRPITKKRTTLALGVYPDISLRKARERRGHARQLLADGVDPAEERKQTKQKAAQAAQCHEYTFERVATDWMSRQDVSDATARKNRWLMHKWLFPEIGHLPVDEITSRVMLDALRKIEATGKLETAQRAKIKAGQVFRYAIIEQLIDSDPTASLRGALKTPDTRHHAAITDPVGIGGLLRAIDGYSGHPVTLVALKFTPLVFVRPGELRRAEWHEIDWLDAMWRIPAKRMKMPGDHIVPLSMQSLAVLRELWPLTGHGRYLFPSIRTDHRPMSENTVTAALRKLGYTGDEMTAHGFRSIAATRLNELGWNPDAIERQLAHAESNKVRAAYTHAAQYLDERIKMMQAWADYLDALKSEKRVIPIKRKA